MATENLFTQAPFRGAACQRLKVSLLGERKCME